MTGLGRYFLMFQKGVRFTEVEASLARAIEGNRCEKPGHIVMHMDDIDRIIREEPVKRCENRRGLYFEIDGIPVTDDPYWHEGWP